MKKIRTLSILMCLSMLFVYMSSAQTEAENLLNQLLSGTDCAPGPEMMELEEEFLEELPEERFSFDAPSPLLTAAHEAHPALYAQALTELEKYIATEKRRTGSFSYGNRIVLHPIARAAERGHTATMALLIDCGAYVNGADEFASYQTPLHLATQNHQPEAVQMLLRHGANVNQIVLDSAKTPLHLAAENGDLASTHALVRNGASVDGQDNNRNTPLHLAAENGYEDVVKFLVEEGALLQKSRQGLTPLGAALHSYILQGDASKKRQIKETIQYLVFFDAPRSGQDKEKLDALFPDVWLTWQPKKRAIKEILMPHLDVVALEELTTQFVMPSYVKRTAEEPLSAKEEKRQRIE